MQRDQANSFGHQRLADFYLDPGYVNVNHGSYGSCPRKVVAAKRKWQERMDFNTQKWFRWDCEQLLTQTRTLVAKRIHCNPNNLFIVQNATDGFNCLVKNLDWQRGDVIVVPNTAYSCVRKTIDFLQEKYAIEVLIIEFTEEDFQSAEKIQIKVEDTVNSYPKRIKLAVIDHIISVPAIVMPLEGLAAFFDEKGIPLFVDGAHAVCQADINISDLEVDGYFSNFHKWAFAPKNAAFLYISDKYLNVVRPVITGNFRGEGPAREFFWTGTRDMSSYLSIKDGLDYFDSFGEKAVEYYNQSLSIKAAEEMARIWGTSLLTNDKRLIGYMNNVRVPSDDLDECVKIAKLMLDNFNCYPIIFKFQSHVYCRISAQIYNQLSDYQFAAQKFKQLLEARSKQTKQERQ